VLPVLPDRIRTDDLDQWLAEQLTVNTAPVVLCRALAPSRST
jgi:hypothetical protein